MKDAARGRRHTRITKKMCGTKECPRLIVFRSKKHLYTQLVDDQNHRVLAGLSTLSKAFKEKNIKASNCNGAKELGKTFAQKVLTLGIDKVCFDRAGYRYHGRVKALAEGAREGGLKF